MSKIVFVAYNGMRIVIDTEKSDPRNVSMFNKYFKIEESEVK
jgi:hypothetical protein